MTSCERINELISGYLDEELVQGDQQKVEVHLKSCPSCKKVFEDMKQLRDAVSKSSVEVELSREQLELIMNDLPAKTSQGIGWVFLITGILSLAGFLIWQFAIDDEIPLFVKVVVSMISFGIISLFFSVLRQRMLASKSDRYKDVQI